MPKFHKLSLADQTAAHLRDGVRSGRWKNRLPGVRALRVELDVSTRTLLAALKILREEGLIDGGDGVPFSIVSTKGVSAPRSLRVGLLIRGPLERLDPHVQTFFVRLVMQCRLDGHDAFIVAAPSDKDPHATGPLRKLVRDAKADAWLLQSVSLETIRWFESTKVPLLALGGRVADLPVASAVFQVEEPLRVVVRKLADLGHRRIVLIIIGLSRRPVPSPLLLAFLDELKRNGITPGPYNTPEWTETPEGLSALMNSLFKVTPPTAIINWEFNTNAGILSFLERRGLSVPSDVSFFCYTDDPGLAWFYPGMRFSRFGYDENLRLRFIRRWLDDVARGRPPARSFDIPVSLDEGATLGPVKS